MRIIKPGLVHNEHHTTTAMRASSVAVMQLHTERAAKWMRENVAVEEYQKAHLVNGGRVGIEKQYVGDIVTALDEALGIEYEVEEVRV